MNWDWCSEKIKNAKKPVKVLNLFAYTGGATLAAAEAGAQVTHVDASKGMVQWAKENAACSGLKDAPIRWLVDDCVKFVEREIRRGSRYHGIIMEPLFFLINSYTTGLAPSVLTYMLSLAVKERFGGHVESDEIGLPVSGTELVLPCGASGRWSR